MNADPAEPKEPERGRLDGERPRALAPGRTRRTENPFGLVPLLILVVLVVGGLFVVFELRDISNTQDCVMSGRKNCAPVNDPSGR